MSILEREGKEGSFPNRCLPEISQELCFFIQRFQLDLGADFSPSSAGCERTAKLSAKGI